MIKYLFLDLDQTILDFRKGETTGLVQALRSHGVESTAQVLAQYHQINRWHWEQLELGKLSQEEVLVGRFRTLFARLGVEADAQKCAQDYEYNLSLSHFFLPGAQEALNALYGKYRLYLASNGTPFVQHRRLKDADLYRFFDGIFLSGEVGYSKPAAEFFEAAFRTIPGFDREQAVMVGDTLPSDILGGIHAGIQTVWVNPEHAPAGAVQPDHQIDSLAQLPGLLETL